jgi:hypothetical protein
MIDEITITEDGRTMHGSTWVRPTDWQDDDLAAGLLPAMKGATPETLPTLDDGQADDQSTHFLRNDFPIFQP